MDRYIKESDFLNAIWWNEDNKMWEITDERLEKLQINAIESNAIEAEAIK